MEIIQHHRSTTVSIFGMISSESTIKIEKQQISEKSSATKPVESTALPLESIDHIHGGHSLPPSVLGVRHSISDDVLKEYLEDPPRLLVDQPADPLDSASPCQATDRRLRDALDVVPENLAVPLCSALAQPLASLATARHFQ
ncbi:histone H4 [Striga asiatica]|uniref:Histone H4 n=1 Tax=Striga asiatica TaxID=4170 RepID=A0A5A7R3S3_STRAF|nr:histone H4 [Striga asiatica]